MDWGARIWEAEPKFWSPLLLSPTSEQIPAPWGFQLGKKARPLWRVGISGIGHQEGGKQDFPSFLPNPGTVEVGRDLWMWEGASGFLPTASSGMRCEALALLRPYGIMELWEYCCWKRPWRSSNPTFVPFPLFLSAERQFQLFLGHFWEWRLLQCLTPSFSIKKFLTSN